MWQNTLRTLCGSQTLLALRRQQHSIRKATAGGLVHQGSISGKLDLEIGPVDEVTDREKNGEWIVASAH